MDINDQTVGIVVPTLGQRNGYLAISLKSIKACSNVYVAVICPDGADLASVSGLFDLRITDPGTGLPDAINKGFSMLPSGINIINWLGDDDYLEPNSIDVVRNLLLSDSSAVAVFGKCTYVNDEGGALFLNHSGSWAVPLLAVGPNMIPQPGMLFRRSSFNQVGGLNPKYGLAFDFDLLLKFKRIGKIKYLNRRVANFRWHNDSLSVGHRRSSVREASQIRVSHLPTTIRFISFIWEKPIMWVTLLAGKRLSKMGEKG